jgi:hypothetical protein
MGQKERSDDVLKMVYYLLEAGAILVGAKVTNGGLSKVEIVWYLRLFKGLQEIQHFINPEKELPNVQNN